MVLIAYKTNLTVTQTHIERSVDLQALNLMITVFNSPTPTHIIITTFLQITYVILFLTALQEKGATASHGGHSTTF